MLSLVQTPCAVPTASAALTTPVRCVDSEALCDDPRMTTGMAIVAMVIATGLLQRVVTREPSERTRVMRAYRAAWKKRAVAGEPDHSPERLIAEMKAENVPGVYTQPDRPLIRRAAECWQADIDPRRTNRALKHLR